MAAAALLLASASAQAGSEAEIGSLVCNTIPGSSTNLLIHSHVGLDCTFKAGSKTEHYKGETGVSLGLDIDWKRQSTMRFTVMTTSDKMLSGGELAGNYSGVKASATVGAGVGSQKYVGGGDGNFSLVPVSLDTSTGAGVAGGLGYLHLEPK